MAYSAVTVRDAIVSILAAANTTTATNDLSAGLQTRVQAVIPGGPNFIPDLYPLVVVHAASKSVEHALIGNSGRRDVTLQVNVLGYTNLMIPGTSTGSDEVYRLTDNIETVLENAVDLSGTVSFSQVEDVQWSTADGDTTYAQVGSVNLRAVSHSAA